MALRTFVKVSGVNNLSDARYCAGMGVDLIGFNLDPSQSGYLSPESFKEITDWISGVSLVAEFNGSTIETIINQLSMYQVHYLQVSSPELVHKLKPLGIPVILKLEASSLDNIETSRAILNEYKDHIAFFIFESDLEIPATNAFEITSKLATQFPIVLGFGISENNIEEILENHSFKGISIKGGEEIKPGYKDFDELAGILEAIEIDDLA
jgi:phosphoribosylanthranilate isomerase